MIVSALQLYKSTNPWQIPDENHKIHFPCFWRILIPSKHLFNRPNKGEKARQIYGANKILETFAFL